MPRVHHQPTVLSTPLLGFPVRTITNQPNQPLLRPSCLRADYDRTHWRTELPVCRSMRLRSTFLQFCSLQSPVHSGIRLGLLLSAHHSAHQFSLTSLETNLYVYGYLEKKGTRSLTTYHQQRTTNPFLQHDQPDARTRATHGQTQIPPLYPGPRMSALSL